jgi:hypothetical protein
VNRWRIVENKWNLKLEPWHGGYGIEEVDDDLVVPSLVCWFYRGTTLEQVQRVVDLHNADLEKMEKMEL